MPPVANTITALLHRWSDGDEDALDVLAEVSYGDLRCLAAAFLNAERSGHTLLTDDLVNETFLRLMDQTRVNWQNRGHYMAVAARLMRRVLIDHARRKYSLKRGGEAVRITLSDLSELPPDADIIALDAALDELDRFDHELSQIVELRFFGGFSLQQIGELLGLSEVTIRRRFRVARAWLARRLEDLHE